MTQASLPQLRARFQRGELPRDDYWSAAQAILRSLRERTPLPDDGPVAHIEASEAELVIELRDGIRMQWDPDDLRTAPNMLLLHGAYEAREAAVLTAIARPGCVVLDIGANVGWYTLMLARIVAPSGGHVYAAEPIPRTRRALERNVALNRMQSTVTVLPCGFGERAESLDFFLPERTGSVAASSRPLFADQPNERVTVPIERLDDAAPALGIRRLDLLKADVEGAELFVLRGALETIRRFRPVLFLELLRKWSAVHGYHPNDVIALLRPEGYQCRAITNAGLEPLQEIDERCEATNFLFVHEDSSQPVSALLDES